MATLADRWNSSRCGTLALEAEALGVFNRALARFMAAPDADKPAAMARALLFAGCSRPADELMIPMSKQGLLEHFLPTQEAVSLGLRLAEQVLVRMAHTNPPPRVVERLLALWAREAVGPQGFVDRRVSERIAACDAGSVFAEQLALESTVFSADMRASVRDARIMARYVLHGAMAAMLGHVLARPNDVDIGDALALHACKAAESRAEDAGVAATAAAAAAAAGGAADARQQAAAAEAQAEADKALEVVAFRVEAARAARRGERAGAPPGGPAGAARGGRGSDNSDDVPYSESSEDAERERMLEHMKHMAASDVSDSEYRNDTEYSDEVYMDLDDMDHDLACELDGEQTAAALTDDRTACACLLGINFSVSKGCSLQSTPGLPVVKGALCTKTPHMTFLPTFEAKAFHVELSAQELKCCERRLQAATWGNSSAYEGHGQCEAAQGTACTYPLASASVIFS